MSLSTGQTNRTACVQFWTVRARRISLRCAVHCALKTLARFEKRLSVDAHRIAKVILCIAPKRSALCVSSSCQSFHDMHRSSVLIRFENTVKAIILTRRIYNDFPKLTSLRVPKVTILTHSQRSIGQYMIVSISV